MAIVAILLLELGAAHAGGLPHGLRSDSDPNSDADLTGHGRDRIIEQLTIAIRREDRREPLRGLLVLAIDDDGILPAPYGRGTDDLEIHQPVPRLLDVLDQEGDDIGDELELDVGIKARPGDPAPT